MSLNRSEGQSGAAPFPSLLRRIGELAQEPTNKDRTPSCSPKRRAAILSPADHFAPKPSVEDLGAETADPAPAVNPEPASAAPAPAPALAGSDPKLAVSQASVATPRLAPAASAPATVMARPSARLASPAGAPASVMAGLAVSPHAAPAEKVATAPVQSYAPALAPTNPMSATANPASALASPVSIPANHSFVPVVRGPTPAPFRPAPAPAPHTVAAQQKAPPARAVVAPTSAGQGFSPQRISAAVDAARTALQEHQERVASGEVKPTNLKVETRRARNEECVLNYPGLLIRLAGLALGSQSTSASVKNAGSSQ